MIARSRALAAGAIATAMVILCCRNGARAADPLGIIGRITDPNGKPVAGAVVRAWHYDRFHKPEIVREAVSRADGTYSVRGLAPRMALVAATAKSLACQIRDALVEPGMPPVDFQLKPGATIRIRVVDEHNHPIPKARVAIDWNREEDGSVTLDFVNPVVDEHGLWEWREAAAAAELNARVSSPDRMDAEIGGIAPRASAYVVQPRPILAVLGKVIDSQTKRPIKRFRVLPGAGSAPDDSYWRRRERFAGADGQFEFRTSKNYGGTQFLRVEAEGYRPAVSRAINSDEGKVSLEYALVRGEDLDAVVLKPDGRPAANAKVAVAIAGAHLLMKNGDLDPHSNAAFTETDASGRFHFPPQDPGFFLGITHSTGYAFYNPGPQPLKRTINLDPWSRVEGVYRTQGQPVGKLCVSLHAAVPRLYKDRDVISATWEATTAPNGSFIFDRVPAGHGAISRCTDRTFNDGWTISGSAAGEASTSFTPVDVPLGKSVRVNAGGNGRSANGKLRPPANFKQPVFWNFALLHAEPESDENRPRQRFNAIVSRDGRFRIDDMPPGEYSLSISFSRFDCGYLDEVSFSIPETQGRAAAKPIDLGVLTLHADN